MRPIHQTFFLLIIISIAGLIATYQITARWRAISSEEVRRLEVLEHPHATPNVVVQDSTGNNAHLLQALAADGRVAIVTFIYTRCNAVCTVLGAELQQLQSTIKIRHLDHRIRLISISFDPADSVAHLARYANSLDAQAHIWEFFRVIDATQRNVLLRSFGVVAVPAPLGQFEHNAAFHLLDSDGKLARIVDFDDPEGALASALLLSEDLS